MDLYKPIIKNKWWEYDLFGYKVEVDDRAKIETPLFFGTILKLSKVPIISIDQEESTMNELKCPKCGSGHVIITGEHLGEDCQSIDNYFCCYCNYLDNDLKKWEESTMNEMPELKTGMVVELRGGSMFRVMEGTVYGNYLTSRQTVINMKDYNENLINEKGKQYLDIIKIYQQETVLEWITRVPSEKDIIWQRQEPRKVTMSEVAEKFGCEVEIVEG